MHILSCSKNKHISLYRVLQNHRPGPHKHTGRETKGLLLCKFDKIYEYNYEMAVLAVVLKDVTSEQMVYDCKILADNHYNMF